MRVKATFIAMEEVLPFIKPILPLLEAAEAMFTAKYQLSGGTAFFRISDGWVEEEYVLGFSSPEALVELAASKDVPLPLEIAFELTRGVAIIVDVPIEQTLEERGLVPVEEKI